MLDQQPDSSLILLKTIDKNRLGNKEEQARHALLMSMALDKNYMDTTTFDILQPAIDNYLKKGTPDEKLRTYYYQGRIFQNQGNDDKALQAFSNGIDISDNCIDSLLIAKTYAAQGYTYHSFYNFKDEIDSYLKAAKFYNTYDDHYRFECLLNVLNAAVQDNNRLLADSMYKVCNSFTPVSSNDSIRLLEYNLTYVNEFGDIEEIRNHIKQYEEKHKLSLNGLMTLALAYHKINENRKSLELLDIVKDSGQPYDTVRLLSVSVRVFDKLNNFKMAYETFLNFHLNVDVKQIEKMRQGLIAMTEKHQLQLNAQNAEIKESRLKWGIIIFSIIFIISIFAVIMIFKNLRTQKKLAIEREMVTQLRNKELENQLTSIKDGYRSLEELLYSKADTSRHTDLRKSILKRIGMLNTFLAGYITNNEKYNKVYDDWVKEITHDKDEFMNYTRQTLEACYPDFITYLENHDLTDFEIKIVCLYAIGLSTNEVGYYIKKGGYRNVSSVIREKLGIKKEDGYIGPYVRKIIQEF